MSVSRTSPSNLAELNQILEAEKIIAGMGDADFARLEQKLGVEPDDGHLNLWYGLGLAQRDRHPEACAAFTRAIELGCRQWRIGWYIAQSARQMGQLDLVDQSCARVLELCPEFWFAREFPKHARGYYAQMGQDQLIEEFFREQPPRAKVFVEVGAFDGVHYSNVRRLQERYGWTGLCIEPVQKNFAKLSQSYRGTSVKCVRAAVTETDGEMEMNVSTYPHLPDWGSDVASLTGEDMGRWQRQYGAQWTKEKVPARKLTTLLDGAGIRQFDLLSIDAEGHDLEVLKSLNFNRFSPKLIIVEYGPKREAIARFLARQGYTLLLDNGQDLVAAKLQPLAMEGVPLKETKHFTGLSGKPGYEEIQNEMENHLDRWLKKPADQIERIVVVGGYCGHEIRSFLKNYPKAEIHVFEPSRRYFPKLEATYAGEPRVKAWQLAIGEQPGTTTFHEGSLEGVGSLLPLKTKADAQSWIPDRFKPAETYQVAVTTLDEFAPLQDKPIDLLWLDIQGAELKALRGARRTMGRSQALFLEVAATKTTYHGQCKFWELNRFCLEEGFYLAGIGLCPTGNGTGNALWRRAPRAAAPAPLPLPQAQDHSADPERLKALINPHLLTIIPLQRFQGEREMNPLQLLNPQRFDIAAKHLYARLRERGTAVSWARQLYAAHLKAFNNLKELDGSGKDTLEKYSASFHELLDAIKRGGFDPEISLVPVNSAGMIIDGAHRLAACLLHQKPIRCVEAAFTPQPYGYEFFRQRGLDDLYSDEMALEYCRLHPETYLVMVFPSAQGRQEEVEAILNQLGQIVYAKQIWLSRQGSFHLIRQVYAGERWLGDWTNQYAGAWGKANPCFAKSGPLRVFVFQAHHLDQVREAKKRIRDLFGIENHSVHINDTREQTLQLARLLLNRNSIHFLNGAQPKFFGKFERQIRSYATWLKTQGYDPELFCVDGSAVMAAYGIRESADLDVLHACEADFSTVEPEVNSHNREVHHHVLHRDDIIFNPENHFYYNGLKFASLDVIRRLKVKRNERKDREDVAKIDALVAAAPIPPDGCPLMLPSQQTTSAHSSPQDTVFTNDWFLTHEKHWNEFLVPWAKSRPPLNILEIGSFEGRSACWFLTHLMDDPGARLTCIDPWWQQTSQKVYAENMEGVFERFQKNIRATGRAAQVQVIRGDSRTEMPKLPAESFDLIYVDGNHTSEAVREDSLLAIALLKAGGLIVWDDYYWSPPVAEGVDRACAELNIQVRRMGNNAVYQKPKAASPERGESAPHPTAPPSSSSQRPLKIVGLVPARNESVRIAFCLRALAVYTDAIIYLDDCSQDDTVKVVESLAQECRIERIIRKTAWHRDEPGDRNAMLKAGREIGGTHFIVLDADEAFTANCADHGFLRRLILTLRPGDYLGLNWIQLWRGIEYYRFDQSVWTWNLKAFAFCDDGHCSYQSEFIHTSRVPGNLRGRVYTIPGYAHGVLHFQFTHWRNLLVKQAWYRCMERLRDPQKPGAAINQRYAPSKEERNLGLKRVPPNWLAGYSFFDPAMLDATETWREAQVLGWFEQHGRKHFQDLDIWDIGWGKSEEIPPPSVAYQAARKAADEGASQENRQIEQWTLQAEERFQRDDLAGARQALQKALAWTPDSVELSLCLGNVLFLMGDLAGARWEFIRVASLQPSSVQAHVLWAAASAQLKDREEARRVLAHALRLDPTHAQARELLAEIEAQENPAPGPAPLQAPAKSDRRPKLTPALQAWLHHTEIQTHLLPAVAWLENELNSQPASVELLAALGGLRMQLGQGEIAYRLFAKACLLRPDNPALLVKRAAAAIELGKIDEFEATLEQALRLEAENEPALRLLIQLNLRQEQFQDAANTCLRLLKRQPGDIPTLIALAQCFLVMGDLKTAWDVFTEILRLDPANAHATKYLAEIQHKIPAARPREAADILDAAGNGQAAAPGAEDKPSPSQTREASMHSAPTGATNGEKEPAGLAPSKPRISAIVSSYNSERFIRGCLENLEAQTIARDLEIIVVDAASPQNERAIVEEFQQRYSNIVYIRLEQRETVYAAWNRAIRAARGQYITNANTDDRHRADALEILARTLDENPEVTLVYADCLITRTENETFNASHPVRKFQWHDFDPAALVLKGCFVGPQPMWRREVHEEHGYFDADFVSAGDYEFWLRIARNRKFLHVKQTLGLYLESPGSVEHRNQDRAAREAEEAKRRYGPYLVPGYPGKPAGMEAPSSSSGQPEVQTVSPEAAGPPNRARGGGEPAGSPAAPAALPSCAMVGDLAKARELFNQKNLAEAWAAVVAALQRRPYHPEAYLLLAKIALAAGDSSSARRCARYARELAPEWKAAKQFLKGNLYGHAKPAWLKLPEALTPEASAAQDRISVCLIVKNEERFLRQCLASVKDLAYQMVVVDTGSTDRSVEIAREFGAEVHFFAWCDDFSAARNVALEQARGDWILVLDADEELPAGQHACLRADIKNRQILAFRLPLINQEKEANGRSYVPRLYRNLPGAYYEGRIHEQIFSSLIRAGKPWGLTTGLGTAEILHHGYTTDMTKDRNKVDRNLALLKQAIREQPTNPHIAMSLGFDLVRAGEMKEGLAYCQKAYQLMSKQPPAEVVPELREVLLSQYAFHLYSEREYQPVIDLLTSPLARRGGLTASMHLVLGLSQFELKQYENSAEQMRACLGKLHDPTLSPVNTTIYTASPHLCLAVSLAKLGDISGAEKEFEAGLLKKGGVQELRLSYAKMLHLWSRPADALKQLHALVTENPGHAEAWKLGGAMALSQPQLLEVARDWTEEAVRQLPLEAALRPLRAEALLLSQDLAGARAEWERLCQQDRNAKHLGALILIALAGDTPLPAPPSPSETMAVSQAFMGWYRKCLKFGAGDLLQRLHARANQLRPVLPEIARVLEAISAEVNHPAMV